MNEPQGTLDINIRLAFLVIGPKLQDPNYCRRPTQLYMVMVCAIFVAKGFSLTHTINAVHLHSYNTAINVLSYYAVWAEQMRLDLQNAKRMRYMFATVAAK